MENQVVTSQDLAAPLATGTAGETGLSGGWGLDFLRQLLTDGGPIVAILLLLSVFVAAVIIVKIWQFQWFGVGRRGKADLALRLWIAGDEQQALALVAHSRNPVSKVLAHGMRGLRANADKLDLVREDV
ncbi:MAG: hypothetical protein C0606_06285 [Hyphomicrobiales bacterium]|nr:MAG: hypothetical protein C0606_06285 [Hyphomicrobiales bacterium]